MAIQNALGDLNLQETQTLVKTAVETVATNSAGKSTEATQLQIKTAVDAVNASTQTVASLADAVFTLAQDLKGLLVCKGSAADLRVTLLSGTVNTVNTVSNAQSIGGYDARTLVFNTMNSTFNLGVASNIVVS